MASIQFTDDATGRVMVYIADNRDAIAVGQQRATPGPDILNVNIYLGSGQTINCEMRANVFDNFIADLERAKL
jgi:hypothetical protein